MEPNSTQTLALSLADVQDAQHLTRRLGDVPADELRVVVTDSHGHTVEVPTGLVNFLCTALRIASKGDPVTLTGLPAQLTSTEAARLLGISRPTLIKMAREGKIASHKVGTHTRFFTDDVQGLAEELAERATASLNLTRATRCVIGSRSRLFGHFSGC